MKPEIEKQQRKSTNQRLFFEGKVNKIDKALARLTKKKMTGDTNY